MPPTQSKDQCRFTEGLATYQAAIEASKKALSTAIQSPSAESKKADRVAHREEKTALKAYKKATKKLRSRIE